MTTGRNDPCPCGSGIKYKKCCLEKGDPVRAKRQHVSLISAAVIMAVAFIIGMTIAKPIGIIVGFLGLVALGIWLWLTAPPPSSTGGADPSAINFGR